MFERKVIDSKNNILSYILLLTPYNAIRLGTYSCSPYACILYILFYMLIAVLSYYILVTVTLTY